MGLAASPLRNRDYSSPRGREFGRSKQLETKVGGEDVIRMVRATEDSEIAGGGQASGFYSDLLCNFRQVLPSLRLFPALQKVGRLPVTEGSSSWDGGGGALTGRFQGRGADRKLATQALGRAVHLALRLA